MNRPSSDRPSAGGASSTSTKLSDRRLSVASRFACCTDQRAGAGQRLRHADRRDPGGHADCLPHAHAQRALHRTAERRHRARHSSASVWPTASRTSPPPRSSRSGARVPASAATASSPWPSSRSSMPTARTQREYYLAAAVYAYAFLFGEPDDLRRGARSPRAPGRRPLQPGPGQRTRQAGHRRGRARGSHPGAALRAVSSFAATPTELHVGPLRHDRFISVGEYKVRGLRNRYRQPGIGAPLAAEVAPEGGPEASTLRKYVPARSRSP